MVFDTFAKNIENATVFTVLKDFEFFLFFFFQILGYYQGWLAGWPQEPGAGWLASHLGLGLAGWPATWALGWLSAQPLGPGAGWLDRSCVHNCVGVVLNCA